MNIEIYVVKTELYRDLTYLTYEEKKSIEELETERDKLIDLFNGLTIIPNCLGFFRDKLRGIETDKTEIWKIVIPETELTEAMQYSLNTTILDIKHIDRKSVV